MHKLLSANFSRLWKDKIFWSTLVVVITLSFVNILNSVQSCATMIELGYIRTLDDYYFNQASLMSIFFGLFVSLYLGTEYSDGTLRNKLIIGHKRVHIYFSYFIVCTVASLILTTAWLIIAALGFFLIGPMEMGIFNYISYIVIIIGFTISFVALFTMIGIISSNKAMAIVYMMVVIVSLEIIVGALYGRLTEPEFNEGMLYIEGQLVMQEPTPNPLYLSGTIRILCQCIMELIPNGQALLTNYVSIEHPIRVILFSMIFTIGILTLGCSLFRRKDIK